MKMGSEAAYGNLAPIECKLATSFRRQLHNTKQNCDENDDISSRMHQPCPKPTPSVIQTAAEQER